MNWADFQPGRRVLCVREDGGFPAGLQILGSWPRTPLVGRVYTIKSAEPGAVSGVLSLDLVEIINEPPHFLWNGKLGSAKVLFLATHFRPLDESRLDQFRKLLAPSPEKAVQP
ncbi:hypothetical protein J5N58_01355 [Rhizobium cremeum]|uniref:hypothetical protein n=1 Tax=Rhizobium cremeum TaxID=2813827 RepID=UPI001FD11FE9|nr:hypothetical protein [Rhizobium cremeum]MCJ7993244.1 hypothetical protein [Rhizobium cremeum]MCJ7998309.1 hypothetical protein [Rhizobium cremeum]